MRFDKRIALLSLASVLLLSGTAVGQQLPPLPPEGAVAPQGGGVDPALAAPYPVQPIVKDGNMSLEGVGDSIDVLTEDASKGLDRMTDGLVPDRSASGRPEAPGVVGAPGLAGTPGAPAARPYVDLPKVGVSNDVEDVARNRQDQKDLLRLQNLNEKADLANALWEKVYNNDNAIAARLAAQKEAADAARREAEDKAREQSAAGQPSQALPMAAPVVVEVFGEEASILVPGVGVVMARRGATLSNGMRVADIGVSGVAVVDSSGRRSTLGFGTSVGGSVGGQ